METTNQATKKDQNQAIDNEQAKRAAQAESDAQKAQKAFAACGVIAGAINDKDPVLAMTKVVGKEIEKDVKKEWTEAAKKDSGAHLKVAKKFFRKIADEVSSRLNSDLFIKEFDKGCDELLEAINKSNPEVVAGVFRWLNAKASAAVLDKQAEYAKAVSEAKKNNVEYEGQEPEAIYSIRNKPVIRMFREAFKDNSLSTNMSEKGIKDTITLWIKNALEPEAKADLLKGLQNLAEAIMRAARGGVQTKGGTPTIEYAEVALGMVESLGQKASRIVQDAISSDLLKVSKDKDDTKA